MGRDTPRPRRDVTERGLHANNREDPTTASYLSSAFYLLSVPTFVAIAVGGYVAGMYPYAWIVPVFTALLVGWIAVVFAVMHRYSGR